LLEDVVFALLEARIMNVFGCLNTSFMDVIRSGVSSNFLRIEHVD